LRVGHGVGHGLTSSHDSRKVNHPFGGMKMARTVVLCVLSACLLAAQNKSSGTEQEVMRIEKEMLAAMLKGDASPSERYLADNYVFTGPDGLNMGKAQSIEDLKSGNLKLQAATLDNSKVQVYGDTAIVTYSSNDKGTYKGKDISGKTRWTDVFVKQKGRWMIVATHGSPVR
jgi:ketosteroid isomerase-like protein